MPRTVKKFSDLSRCNQLRRIQEFRKTSLENNGVPMTLRGTVKRAHCGKPVPADNSAEPESSTTSVERSEVAENAPTLLSDAFADSSDAGETFEAVKSMSPTTIDILRRELPVWAIKHNIPQNAVSALLRLCQVAGLHGLPVDARTLLATPRVTDISTTRSGEYYHYGLEEALKDQLKQLKDPKTTPTLELKVHVDGLPIAKSSQSTLWPLLGQIANDTLPPQRPFLIGTYHGYCKPSDPEEILSRFCEEYLQLRENGFLYNSAKYSVQIKAVLCDAPARAFITGVIGHNGSFGCSKCEVEGDYINNRMTFLNEDAVLRTDSSFRDRVNQEYHKRHTETPFEVLNVGMVSQFPLDYMHLVCLGVHKKLIGYCLDGCPTVKLSSGMKKELSQDLLSLAEYVPVEFARGVRGLDDFSRWKATEHRTFLLYIGPVVLQRYLPEEHMQHYNCLHAAIRILCDPADYKRNNKFAHDLLVAFVQAFKTLYGAQNISYNVHNLIHLARDAMAFGPLDAFSCFPFENYLKTVKHVLRKGDRPLAQISRRFNEMASMIYAENESECIVYPALERPSKDQPPENMTDMHHQLRFEDFVLSTKRKADSTCYLVDGTICSILHIGKKNNGITIRGNILLNPTKFENYPCESTELNIFHGRNWSGPQDFAVSQIRAKAVRLLFRGDSYILPMLHGRE